MQSARRRFICQTNCEFCLRILGGRQIGSDHAEHVCGATLDDLASGDGLLTEGDPPRNDPALFVRLMVRHQNDLLRYVLPLVACLDDAQDVVQESATALWKKFDEYNPDQPFLPWAKRFARYEVLMHHRRRRRYSFLTEELIETLAEPDRSHEEDAERRQRVLAGCLEKLPAADRTLLDRRYSDPDATVGQLADEVGRPANVLYKALGRIRRQLLECMTRALAAPEAG